MSEKIPLPPDILIEDWSEGAKLAVQLFMGELYMRSVTTRMVSFHAIPVETDTSAGFKIEIQFHKRRSST